MAEMDLREEVRVAWGTGIAGYVAESGEPVNIPDAYQVNVDADGGSSAQHAKQNYFPTEAVPRINFNLNIAQLIKGEKLFQGF